MIERETEAEVQDFSPNMHVTAISGYKSGSSGSSNSCSHSVRRFSSISGLMAHEELIPAL